jgi:hypothetical protein
MEDKHYDEIIVRIQDVCCLYMFEPNSPKMRSKFKDKLMREIREMALEEIIEPPVPQFDVRTDKDDANKIALIPLNDIAERMVRDIYDMGRNQI